MLHDVHTAPIQDRRGVGKRRHTTTKACLGSSFATRISTGAQVACRPFLFGLCLLFTAALTADPQTIQAPSAIAERTAQLVDRLRRADTFNAAESRRVRVADTAIEVQQCATYPYAAERPLDATARALLDDLADGLETGLRCLGGLGPEGPLHSFHEYQAQRLLNLFESSQTKTFRCVDDEMFATAVATSPNALSVDDPLHAQLRKVSHPAVILDTYRLGGLLSRRHDDETFRNFFHLGDEQILEHRNGQPLRVPNLHRYQNRAALLFHEVVHWLGHEHSAIYPDLTHLYETCCFGGSDYIADAKRNRVHQRKACNILKDDALWADGQHSYRQMRVWHHKEYDTLKGEMRADYAY